MPEDFRIYKRNMKSKHLLILIILLISSVVLSACAGGAATAASSWPDLTVDGETAFVAYNQHVYAIDLATGTQKWRFPLEADNKISFYAAPVITPDGQLLVGGYDHVLYSLNPQTGTENWSFKNAKNRYIGSPLASEAGIFAPTADDNLYALDNQGNARWSFATQGAQWAKPVSDPNCECIYLPSMDHHLYAINAQTGAQEWKSEDLGGSVVGTPAYAPDDTLYIGTFNSEMLAIDANNGRIRWRVTTDGWIWGGPVLKDGALYFGDLSGAFYAMDAADGKVRWKIKPDGPISQSPLLTEESIYFTTEAGSLYGVSYNGDIRVNQPIACQPNGACPKLHTSPVSAGDKILVAPTGVEQLLIALDANGEQIWSFIPEKK